MPTERRSPSRERRGSTKPSKDAKAKEAKDEKESKSARAAKAKEAREAKSAKEPKDEKEAKPKPRKRERRLGDRRESPRLPIPVWVKNASATEFEQVEGDISVGGMHFTDAWPIQGKKIDLRFKLPGRGEEVHVKGEVVQVSSKGARFGAHVRFTDLELDTELAIARYIDDRTP